MKKKNITIFTIGHSTRSSKEFINILKHYHIDAVIDIRTIPKSRFNPQFNMTRLQHSLEKAGIMYCHMSGLGGLRHTTAQSINTAWRNKSFRGFADYMQTREFTTNIRLLIQIAHHINLVIMCAEAVPWRCHRSLIGDALVTRHIKVEDIFNSTHCKPHILTPWAKIKRLKVYYPQKKNKKIT